MDAEIAPLADLAEAKRSGLGLAPARRVRERREPSLTTIEAMQEGDIWFLQNAARRNLNLPDA
jgi:hypothetical protein